MSKISAVDRMTRPVVFLLHNEQQLSLEETKNYCIRYPTLATLPYLRGRQAINNSDNNRFV